MNNDTRKKKTKLKTSPILFRDTQKLVSRIADKLGGAFVTYWNSPNGQVCQDDVQALYEVLERIGKQDAIYLLVKSGGGHGGNDDRARGARDPHGSPRVPDGH